ncbi:MAG: head GIN domain-containing protein [Bacteroidales bacterium]
MKKLSSFVMFTAMLLLTAASDGQSKETRDVKGFTKVAFGVSGDLFITIGPEYSLTMEGDKDVLDRIETDVSGDRLIIRRENWKFSFGEGRVTINLTMPKLESLGVSGSGKARIMDNIEADNLNLNVSGSGKLTTSGLNVDNLECGISGSGDVVLGQEGSIDNGTISISGSGGFSGESVGIDHLDVRVSGSGNCSCKVGDSLTAHISGSGNVTYSGNPKIDAHVSGSGHVRSR